LKGISSGTHKSQIVAGQSPADYAQDKTMRGTAQDQQLAFYQKSDEVPLAESISINTR
jgi:hypothetical protein